MPPFLLACLHIYQVASKDEIEIHIDKIQPRTFHYLNTLVKANLPEKKTRWVGGWMGVECCWMCVLLKRMP